MPQLVQRPRLDGPHPVPRQAKFSCRVAHRPRSAVLQSEPQHQHVPLPVGQAPVHRGPNVPPQTLAEGVLLRRRRVRRDEIPQRPSAIVEVVRRSVRGRLEGEDVAVGRGVQADLIDGEVEAGGELGVGGGSAEVLREVRPGAAEGPQLGVDCGERAERLSWQSEEKGKCI